MEDGTSKNNKKPQQIVEEFKKTCNETLTDNEIINKCVTLCSQFSISPAKLAMKWESYSTTMSAKSSSASVKLTMKELDKFRTSLQKEAQAPAKKNIKKATPKLSNKATDELAALYGDFGADITADELKQQIEDQVEREERDISTFFSKADADAMEIDQGDGKKEVPIISPTKKNPKSGEIAMLYNESVPASTQKDLEVNIALHDFYQKIVKPYRFMNNKLKDRINALEDQADVLSEKITDFYDMEPPTPINTVSQEPIVAVGRICCEVSQGRLNESSVVLQSTKSQGIARTKILLKNIENYSLLPGQTVALEATNPSGGLLVASSIHEGVRMKFDDGSLTSENGLSVVVATGPFALTTASSRLDYSPLDQILQKSSSDETNLLILIGPFVDSQNDVIKSCNIEGTFENFFKTQVASRIKQVAKKLKVVMVPALNDVFHHSVFPQPALDTKIVDKNVFLCPNPSIITVNGVSIGVTSTDIIKHMINQDLSKGREKVNRMALLCDYLINQQNFYPLYPPEESVNLDTTHLDALQFPFTPDILILPSDLKHFLQVTQGCLCVNPGKISKGKMTGTFARLMVHPFVKGESGKERVSSRTRAEIVIL